MAKAKSQETITQERGVIYARYSSSGQREESIEGQIRECREYAERFGINIVGEYCDYALSGKTDKRPEFQRLIKDSAKGQFTVVLLWKIDRFARSKYDSAIYKHRLKQNGVRVIYVKETIPEGPEGIILESVMEGYAEYYSANLSQNVKRGLYESALDLKTLGQKVYGLQKGADGRWEQNPAQAPIVKRIFDEYVSGRPATDIYRDLNAEGFRTITGGPFNKNSLNRILQNEKYCGVYQYADIRVEDGIPAIVSRDTFEKARRMVKLHHEKPAAKKIEGGFLLTGKLFCGHCNAPMTGDGGTSKTGKVYSYYMCCNRRLKKCDKERVSKQLIEDFVVQKLAEIANNDDVINEFADRFMIWQEKQQSASPTVGMEERLKKIDVALKNSMAVIDSGFITESLKKHITELEEERLQVEKGIAQEKLKAPKLERKQVVFFLRKFRKGDINDIGWRIYLVETFLQAAYLFDDGRLLLHLNFCGNNNKITVEIAEKVISEGEELCSNFAPSSPPEKALLLKCFFVSRKELIFMKNQKLKGCAAALLANIIFGFSFLFSKVSLSYAEPLTIAAVRFTLAFAVLSILWAFGAIKMNFKGKKKKKIILMALAQPLFYFVFELYGIANTSSAISGVIISLVPVAVIVLSTLFLKERPTIRQVLFSALSLASVIFISILSNDNKLSTPLGIAFLSGAVLSAAVFNILSRSEAATYSPTERTYIMFLIGAAGFNAIAFCVHGTSFFTSAVSALAQPLFLISVIYLSIVSSIAAFLLYNYATSLITSVQAASFSNIITVVSVLAGIFIMGESLSPVQIICSLLIIIGVLGVNK